MIQAENIKYSDLVSLSAEVNNDQKNIIEIPFEKQFNSISVHSLRVLRALDMEIDLNLNLNLNLQYADYLNSKDSLSHLKETQKKVNDLSATVHGYTDMMHISDLISETDKYGHDLSELVNSYYSYIEKLEKIRFPHLPVKFNFPQKNTLILSIDDLIKKLYEEIKNLKLKIEDAIKFSALLQKITLLTDMSLAVINLWVLYVSRYDAYFTEGASMEGLDEIVNGHIIALKYYRS